MQQENDKSIEVAGDKGPVQNQDKENKTQENREGSTAGRGLGRGGGKGRRDGSGGGKGRGGGGKGGRRQKSG
jgi:hypothetical protein